MSLKGPLKSSLFMLKSLIFLNLSSNKLYGKLENEVGFVKELRLLDLGDNLLSGELPKELGELKKLENLKLGINLFSGKIPPEVGNLTKLQSLDISGNSLSGNIPSEIGKLENIEVIALGNNLLSGSLSGFLFPKLQSLTTFDVSNNSLSGYIPAEIGKLSSLVDLYIGLNHFSGELPQEIGDLGNLQTLFATSCSFSGPLPDSLSKLKSLNKLDLSYNPLKCNIPKSIGLLQNLTILNLVYTELNGSIPSELGMRGFEKNQLSGPLPSWLGKWTQIDSICFDVGFQGGFASGNCSLMTHISLSYNLLNGPIPKELCNAVSLEEIDLDSNFFTGTIEDTFVNCGNLSQLVLVDNQIVGKIPEYLSKLPLMVLDLDSNNFTGRVPLSLWNSKNLMEFSAANNLLEGNIPAEIGNAIYLERLVMTNNRLTGAIPKEIGYLTSLSVLNLNSNLLQGRIPLEIGNCVNLATLDLGRNRLNGSIPEELSSLDQLQCLVLSHNHLSGPIPSKGLRYFSQVGMPDSSFVQHHGVFDLSFNQLSGSIPEELGSCFVLVDVLLRNNMISGEIPRSLARLANLSTLDLSGNLITGDIPSEFGGSSKLQGLYLGNNQLTGDIPESLGQLSSLAKLNLSANKLFGPVPSSIGNLNELTDLDLSYNMLSGDLPITLSRMEHLVGLYVQENRFSGNVDQLFWNSGVWRIEILNLSCNALGGVLPRDLGNLSYLKSLDLHGNGFTGEIPPDLGNLMLMKYLDVSRNKLSGQIPEQICNVSSILYLNFAENQLEGPIPESGICQNLSRVSLEGNTNLCGGITGLKCPLNRISRRRPHLFNVWGHAFMVAGVFSVALFFAIVIHMWITKHNQKGDPEDADDIKMNSSTDQNLYLLNSSSRSKEPLSINIAMFEQFEQPFLKLTLFDILEATNNFCKTRIIGDGGFGTVYKAILPDGKIVAVKKLNEAKSQGYREFLAEMETLGKVKHRNLVSLLGYCSYGDEKFLVYEYMVNGSLDMWLRNRCGALEVLDWSKRFKIALGAARGIAFLHHGFTPHIIHRDIKASNILLSEDFEPKVADFGLARLISACETHVSTDIAGTFGYIPPEYGQSWKSTTRGDVYSFGVILLEFVTGKEPTGPDFKDLEGGNLVGWVVHKIKNGRAVDVLDPIILDADSKQMMLKTLQIAARCLCDNPASRPTMLYVLKFLKSIEEE
ncbi:hypothetical protein Leryth_006912 [Lithospermum erythrorhizon]|nr:hypothetical protein Leryth_006912 [Lithospermum erythrorhizon]